MSNDHPNFVLVDASALGLLDEYPNVLNYEGVEYELTDVIDGTVVEYYNYATMSTIRVDLEA